MTLVSRLSFRLSWGYALVLSFAHAEIGRLSAGFARKIAPLSAADEFLAKLLGRLQIGEKF
jgi:hypothetical protein